MTFEIGQTVEVFNDIGVITGIDMTDPSNIRYLVQVEDLPIQSVHQKNVLPYIIPKN